MVCVLRTNPTAIEGTLSYCVLDRVANRLLSCYAIYMVEREMATLPKTSISVSSLLKKIYIVLLYDMSDSGDASSVRLIRTAGASISVLISDSA